MCSTMCSGAMHKLVRRGLLLRDELGRPQWAAISNNLPSLGSTPPSQLQCIALHINYPTTPTTHFPWVHCNIHTAVRCSSGWVESGVLAICAKPLGEPGVGEGVPTLPTMNWRRSKTKAGQPTNQNFIFRQTGHLGTQGHSIIWFIVAWVLLKCIIYMNCVELRRGSKKCIF